MAAYRAIPLLLCCYGCSFDTGALMLGGTAPGLDGSTEAAPAPDGGSDGTEGCAEGEALCSGDTLQRCTAGSYVIDQVCWLGCRVDEARCYTYLAANVEDGRLDRAEGDLIIQTDRTLDVDAGTLDGQPLPSGTLWAREPQSGGRPDLGVIRVRDFVVEEGARLTVLGTAAVVVIAAREIRIEGTLAASAEGWEAGPGGYSGGNRGVPGAGPQGGAGGTIRNLVEDSGGGGGGSGSHGGAGGPGGIAEPAPGGPSAEDLTLRPLYGGSGGGGGAGDGAPGGGGGGAIQLSAGQRVVVSGRVVATGAGGGGGSEGTNYGAGSGGGGGGAILLEAPEVIVDGTLAAGGGGGGGAAGFHDPLTNGPGLPGEDGLEHGGIAQGGGPGVTGEGRGGNGGALELPGIGGAPGIRNGGGGGGGAGRIHLGSRTGQADRSGTLSPSVASGLVAQSSLDRL